MPACRSHLNHGPNYGSLAPKGGGKPKFNRTHCQSMVNLVNWFLARDEALGVLLRFKAQTGTRTCGVPNL